MSGVNPFDSPRHKQADFAEVMEKIRLRRQIY